jgi:hypothetical protein
MDQEKNNMPRRDKKLFNHFLNKSSKKFFFFGIVKDIVYVYVVYDIPMDEMTHRRITPQQRLIPNPISYREGYK